MSDRFATQNADWSGQVVGDPFLWKRSLHMMSSKIVYHCEDEARNLALLSGMIDFVV